MARHVAAVPGLPGSHFRLEGMMGSMASLGTTSLGPLPLALWTEDEESIRIREDGRAEFPPPKLREDRAQFLVSPVSSGK
jgi:hypothetical protein